MRGNTTLLILASGMMDLSWYYAGATFLTTAVLQRTFPFPEAVGSFALAAALTLFSSGRGWRVIKIMALQALFFVPALLRVAEIFSSWSSSFTHQAWLTSSFHNTTASQNWFTFMLLILWIFPFWGGGMRLAWRALNYDTICSRFDRGLVAFFVLLLSKFVLTVKGNTQIEAPIFEYLIGTFFVCSLLAIGLVRNETTTAERDYIPGYQGLGVIFGFTLVVLLFCAGVTFFCLPYLTMAAEKSYAILKDAAQPLGSLFMIIIHFIFGNPEDWTGKPPEKPPANIPRLVSTVQYSAWMEFLGRILVWGVWILLGLVVILILGVSLYFFVQWLFSKTDLAVGKVPPSHPFHLGMEKLRLFLRECWNKIACAVRRYQEGHRGAAPIYGAVKKWGRRSGLTPFISETPAEYGLRLQSHFPRLKQEIVLIIESFHKEIYGGIILTSPQLAMASSAWFKMRSPRHWPRRLKNLFSHHQDEAGPFQK